MELTPSPSRFSVPMRMPFARTMDLQTGGIDDDITGLLAPTPFDLDGQGRRPAAERAVVWNRQVRT